jgi:HEAT repeat protein
LSETETPPPSAEEEPERQTTPFLVLQFFVFPMAIVAVCVTVFVIFGLIAAEGKGAREYLHDVRSGSANRRWQAAFELSKVLQAGKDPALGDPEFVAEITALFEDARTDDPRVRRYLALALGRLGHPGAVPALREAARSSEDPETRIFSTWALGAIRDESSLGDLVELTLDPDAGIRKAAAHALGGFRGSRVADALAGLLRDPVADVRWNAALALGRRGDQRSREVLLGMLDRQSLRAVEGVTEAQVEAAMLQAVAVSAALHDPEVDAVLEEIAKREESLAVREAARQALESASEARNSDSPRP